MSVPPVTDTSIDALRKKYSRLAESRDVITDAALSGNELAARIAFLDERRAEEAGTKPVMSDALESLRICLSCKGLGVVSSIYNHIVMTRSCETCGGDGVVETKARADAAANATTSGGSTALDPPPLD